MKTIRERLVCSFVTLCLATLSSAAPFAKNIQFNQPDGTAIEFWGEGDEFYAVFETLDGYTIVFDHASGTYVYAALSADGTTLNPTGLQVGNSDPRALGLAKHLRASPESVKAQAQTRFQLWNEGTRNSQRWREKKAALHSADLAAAGGTIALSPPAFTTTGTKVGLCLLIDFSDATNTVPQANIINFCNADAYTGYGNNGSVKKYFQDNSNNLLTYTNIVTAYIRMAQPKSYYNDTSKGCGAQGNLLIQDAVAILKALPNYTAQIAPAMANLTVDGSGQAVACNVFFAGGDSGLWNFGLWPHSWSLYNVGAKTLTAGVSIFNYQITNIGTSLELGTFCHENGHMLCDYPDIYDYDYDSTGGAGMFCLMNSGGHGANPVQICAYLKRASGWATTVDLTSSSSLTASLTSSAGANFNRFYRYVNPGVPTEYYLVENRQKSGRDANIPASGIAVWHIDELGDKDNQSMAYNTFHQNYEVTLVQADNLWHFQSYANSGDTKDLYYSGNTAAAYSNMLSDATAPPARWWSGAVSGINFGPFSTSGTTMTFNVQPAGLTILTASPLPAGSVGVPYSQALAAIGGTAPYTWAVVSNALPAPLTLSGGVISGTPNTAGTTVFRLRVTDSASASFTATMSLTINPPRAVPFTETFENGGTIPSGWAQENVTLATSWSFQTGGYNSYPSTAHGGSYNAFLYIGDRTGPKTKLISPMLDFGAAPQNPQLTFWHCMQNWSGDQDELRVFYKTAATNTWTLLATYTTDVAAWTLRTIVIPTPSRTTFIAFEGCAKFGYGVCIDDVRVSAELPAPTITTATPLGAGIVGVPYSLTLAASNGVTPYTWSMVSNTLPAGLTLGSTGVISGTPSVATNATFRLRVAGSNGLASTNLMSLAIVARRAVPFTETFENSVNMPSGWSQEFVTNATSWTYQSGGHSGNPAGAHGGSNNACLYAANYTGPKTKLVSPPVDFGVSTKNPKLTFWHAMLLYNSDQDQLRVYYKTSSSGTWIPLAEYTNDVSAWTQRTLSLPNPSRTTYIAFEGYAKYGHGVCVDDVTVSGETSPYAIWQTNRFTEAELSAGLICRSSDDPDGDGIANLLEYAMGLNPRLYDTAGVPAGGVWNQFLALNYRQNKQATDLVYAVESCTNLISGGWTNNNLTEISRADSNLWWLVNTRHNVPVTNAPSRFMRLKVTLP